MIPSSTPRVILAHEWLTNWAGSEQVTRAIANISRPSCLYTAIADPVLIGQRFPDVPVHSLWPGRLPAAKTHWSRYAGPMLTSWPTKRLVGDVLLVSSHFAAHGATVRFQGPSLVYYHTPSRMIWRPDLELARIGPRLRPLAEVLIPRLQAYDRWVAQHATVLLANSTAIAERIRTSYGRKASVVYPPVDVATWASVQRTESRHLLWLGRLVAYKRPDLAISLAKRVGLPLVVIGEGPERARLEAANHPGVTFLGHATLGVVKAAMSEAIALVHPGEEDFGIAAVEAQAAGLPVLAYAAGGAMDTVEHNATGFLIKSQEFEHLAEGLNELLAVTWDSTVIRRHAEKFSPERFVRNYGAHLSAITGTSTDERGI